MGHSHNGSVAGRVAGGIKDGEPVRSVTGVASSALMVSDVPQAETEAFKKPPASVRAIGTVGFRSTFIFGNGKKHPVSDIRANRQRGRLPAGESLKLPSPCLRRPAA